MQDIICKRFQSLFLVVLIAVLAALPGQTYAAETIEKITVNIVTVDGGQDPPARIAKRMAASVNTVGEHVLIGHKSSEVTEARSSYERLIKEVFDRILVGYTVESVTLKPGAETNVTVELAPWGEVVREAVLEVDYGSISPELVPLVKQDLGDIEDKVNNVLVGLPIDAVDWAGGVSKSVIQEILATQLPEFRSNFDITAGPKTVVKMSLVPAGAVIQDVHVSLRSNTIPNLLLSQARPPLDDAAKSLNGLPVAFVERHRDYFTKRFTAAASEHAAAREYGLSFTPVISPGMTTEISVNAETSKYKIWLEGYLDMGRLNDNTSAKLHVGKYMSKFDEAFVETNFIPSSVSWRFLPGWSHSLGANTFAGLKYDITDKDVILTLNQNLGRDWSLRAERVPAAGRHEIAVRYKMHDYLSAEYVFTDNDKWLRLVGNL